MFCADQERLARKWADLAVLGQDPSIQYPEGQTYHDNVTVWNSYMTECEHFINRMFMKLGLQLEEYNSWLEAIRTKGAISFPSYSTSSKLGKVSGGCYGGSVDGMRGFASGPYSQSRWEYTDTTVYLPVVGPRDFSYKFVGVHAYARHSHEFEGAAAAYAALPEGWLDQWVRSLRPMTPNDLPNPPPNNRKCLEWHQKWCEGLNTVEGSPYDTEGVLRLLVSRSFWGVKEELLREAVVASNVEITGSIKTLLGFPKDPPPPLLKHYRKWYSPRVVNTKNCDVEITIYSSSYRRPQMSFSITPHDPSSPWEATVESYYGEREVFRG